jgi:hypothetical protein
VDPDRQLVGVGHGGVGLEGPQRRIGREVSRIVDAHDAEADEPMAHGGHESPQLSRRRAGDPLRDELAGVLEEDALRRPVAEAPDDPAIGIGRAGVEARDLERRRTCPDRVVIERPEDRRTSRRDPGEVAGRRPAAPAPLVPARAEQPGALRHHRVPGGEDREPVLEGRGIGQVDVPGGDRRVDQVEMGVHEAGIAISPGSSSIRRCAGRPRLELDGTAGEGDAAAANADRPTQPKPCSPANVATRPPVTRTRAASGRRPGTNRPAPW